MGANCCHGNRATVSSAVTAGLVAMTALTGCAVSPGCTEGGYRNELRVTVAGDDAGQVATIDLCADDICAYSSSDVAPAGVRSYWVIHNTVPNLWIYDFGDHYPSTVELTFLDTAGRTLDEQDHAIDWLLLDGPNGPGCGWRTEGYDLTVTI